MPTTQDRRVLRISHAQRERMTVPCNHGLIRRVERMRQREGLRPDRTGLHAGRVRFLGDGFDDMWAECPAGGIGTELELVDPSGFTLKAKVTGLMLEQATSMPVSFVRTAGWNASECDPRPSAARADIINWINHRHFNPFEHDRFWFWCITVETSRTEQPPVVIDETIWRMPPGQLRTARPTFSGAFRAAFTTTTTRLTEGT